jgi:uncharacterized protein YbcV (DUF1398 family)
MFTKEQIQEAASKVQSGADYPRLIQDLKKLGVSKYDHFVADGSNIYYGTANYSLKIEHDQELIPVNDISSADKLKHTIKMHQAGQTDYPTFCLQAAEAGVEKWVSDLTKMTVSYVDKAGHTLIEEEIPTGVY